MAELQKALKFIKDNIRYFTGGFILILGGAFMVIPFIPLGYIFLGVGAFLLSPIIPWFRQFLHFLEKKDGKNRIKWAEKKVDLFFKRFNSDDES